MGDCGPRARRAAGRAGRQHRQCTDRTQCQRAFFEHTRVVIVELRFATTASFPGAYIFGVGQFGILLLSHALLRPHSEKVTWGIVTPRLIDGRATCLTLHNKVRNMLQMSTIYSEDHEAVKKI